MLAAVVMTAVESRLIAPLVVAMNTVKSRVWLIATLRWYMNANSIMAIRYYLSLWSQYAVQSAVSEGS